MSLQGACGDAPRADPVGNEANFYGSTFRIYDPALDAWHIFWLDPVKQFYSRMLGRADGRDIEQRTVNETPQRRWRFTVSRRTASIGPPTSMKGPAAR